MVWRLAGLLVVLLFGFGCGPRRGPTTPQQCGDGKLAPWEDCDGALLNGQSCASKGYIGGVLRCTSGCVFDTSSCDFGALCGNQKQEPGEECDGADLGGQSCQSRGFASGGLSCLKSCRFDLSGCSPQTGSTCGNGKIEATESCDGAALNGQSCGSIGFDLGALKCSATCTLDASDCRRKAPPKTCPTCPQGQVCDPSSLACVDCLTSADCSAGVCSNRRCVECTKDSDCGKALCSNQRCVQCAKDAHCPGASASRCRSGVCDSCTQDSHCSHISGKPTCDSGACVEGRKCEDWDNSANAPCPAGTKNCDCSGGCGTASSCGSSGPPHSGCFTVANTAARSFEPKSSGGHGSGAFLWKPVSESNGKLVVLFPATLPANKAWVQTPAGAREYSSRVTVSNPNRKTHYFSKPGAQYPNGSKACWSSQ